MNLKLHLLLIIQIPHLKKDDHVNSTPEEQICNIKTELVSLKSFVIEQTYVLKNALKKRKFHQKGSNLVKLISEKKIK